MQTVTPLRMPLPNQERAANEAVAIANIVAFQSAVRRTIKCILHVNSDNSELDDAVQETLRRAIEGAAQPRAVRELRSYVLGIARHVALDEIRARQKQRLRTVPLGDAETYVNVASHGIAPETAQIAVEHVAWLQVELEKLPAKQRDALVLFHVRGLSYAAIAEQLHVPFGTVATWIARARSTLFDKRAQYEQQPQKRSGDHR
jgi:RNA polymerase sigma factor (sigma-70 family)